MLSCFANKNQKNISKVFAVFSCLLIFPFSSFAADFCCSIPEETTLEKPLKYLSSATEEILFYPNNISKQLSEKYKKAIRDYNTFVDRASARNNKRSDYEFTSGGVTIPSYKFTSSKESFQKTLSSGSNWLSNFYEKFLSPKTAEASDIKGIYSYPQLKSILNKKYSFQDNALVEF